MKVVFGVIVEGKKQGRALGFPTANIVLLEPMEGGIYVGQTVIDAKQYRGAVFVYPGTNLFEIYILDFKGDLYGQFLEVQVGDKIRDFENFNSIEDLKKQIAADVEKVRQYNFNLKT